MKVFLSRSRALGAGILTIQAIQGTVKAACPADNCYNALNAHTSSAIPFCSSLLASSVPATATVPTYLANCGAVGTAIPRLSTACPCLLSSLPTTASSCTLATTTITQTATITDISGTGGGFTCFPTSTCALFVTYTTCGASGAIGGSGSTGGCATASTVTSTVTTTASAQITGGGGLASTVTTTTTTTTTVSPVATPSCGTLINGGFELGNLSNWDGVNTLFSLSNVGTIGQVFTSNNGIGAIFPPYAGAWEWGAPAVATTENYGQQQTVVMCATGKLTSRTLTMQWLSAEGTGTCSVALGFWDGNGPTKTKASAPAGQKQVWNILTLPFVYDGTAETIHVFFYAGCTSLQDVIFIDNVTLQ